MASQATPGYKGGLYVRNGTVSTKVAEIREATITIEQKEIDVTSFDSNGWNEYIGGLKGWEVDADALYRENDTSGQTALFTALSNGTTASINLFPRDTSSALGYSGSVIITSFEVGNTMDDAVALSLSMIGTGALSTVSKS
jgi:predicted secreted protein